MAKSLQRTKIFTASTQLGTYTVYEGFEIEG